ncbi:hypothetical protein GCM10011497_30910 [Elstera cyanobacteriorum]|uniref:Lipoprotein n=1 Tax=Elstera cyanobacteriorum TaxID=2022747 RepID=A0A255XVJ1_9PROT|nr:hypothetical protein [Elstera cyanobacteriorum]OYQ20996.1 hypothetical protein CHR90_03440 [Elstera cyanobacteriorum]GFZ98041.1 hypothetical protein GCM10011497_30910 [Elstera cyanobacteriorum]
MTRFRPLFLALPAALALAACQTTQETPKTTVASATSGGGIVQVNGLVLAGLDGLPDLAVASAKIAEAGVTCSLPTKDLDKLISDIDGLLPPLPTLAQGWFEAAYRAERKSESSQRSGTCSEDTDRVRIAEMMTRQQNDLASPAFTNWLKAQLAKK